MAEKIYTVTELTYSIKSLVESNFVSPIKLTGEVSSLSHSLSGHYYFVLKDDNAQIRIVYFKRYAQYNNNRSNYIPKNGDKVVIIGNLTVYEKDGQYQIIAKVVDYNSVGDFFKKYEETRKILEAEGFFEKSTKKELPILPRKIAVLTSPYGAAIKDFIITSRKNLAKYVIDIWPVQVQGEYALTDIVNTLKTLEDKKYWYDIVILMRGGGSLEDLAIFNEEVLARSLANVSVPTITAIGHERDTTICDLVADKSVSTPTQAAMILSQPFKDLNKTISDYINFLTRHFDLILSKNIQLFDKYMAKLESYSPVRKIEHSKEKLKWYNNSLRQTLFNKIQIRKDVEENIKMLKFKFENKYRYEHERLVALTKRLENLDPLSVLKRGYAIVKTDDKVISRVNKVNLEDELEICMYDGYINSFVTGKKMYGGSNGEDSYNKRRLYKVERGVEKIKDN
ncbi:MAG: exodeoxyribonuclease VII large subunit [Deferribacterota bacterium]|nr:exodeoxyribonuclease VII large subunit [Deferribacterota bacterium]